MPPDKGIWDVEVKLHPFWTYSQDYTGMHGQQIIKKRKSLTPAASRTAFCRLCR